MRVSASDGAVGALTPSTRYRPVRAALVAARRWTPTTGLGRPQGLPQGLPHETVSYSGPGFISGRHPAPLIHPPRTAPAASAAPASLRASAPPALAASPGPYAFPAAPHRSPPSRTSAADSARDACRRSPPPPAASAGDREVVPRGRGSRAARPAARAGARAGAPRGDRALRGAPGRRDAHRRRHAAPWRPRGDEGDGRRGAEGGHPRVGGLGPLARGDGGGHPRYRRRPAGEQAGRGRVGAGAASVRRRDPGGVPARGGGGAVAGRTLGHGLGRGDRVLIDAKGRVLLLRAPLAHSYGATGAQVVRVPHFGDVTIPSGSRPA